MDKAYLEKVLCRAGFELPSEDIAALCRYAALLVCENEKYNLTAITDDEGVAQKHLSDSLFGAEFLPYKAKVADLGSGAGLPAVPLAVFRKDLNITAIESTGKKANFLRLASDIANIGNLNIENSRIEDFARTAARASFDAVTARAVAPLNTLLEYAFPLLKKGGVLVAYKGQNSEDDMADAGEAIEKFHAKLEKVSRFSLENGDKRVIMIFRKEEDTPEEYPRPQNKPRLKPIGGKKNG